MDRADLWQHIGFVPQKAFLFSGTVASNLRYGNPDATDEELWHALGSPRREEFVRAMPEGLDEPITQGGTNVSGGQRQRLAIARAIVKKPDIYVFDDSFSALDFKTDSHAARRSQARRPRTPRSSWWPSGSAPSCTPTRSSCSTRAASCGLGDHEELLETCETYQEIVYSQLTRGGSGMSAEERNDR